MFAFDTETDGLSVFKGCRPFLFSWADGETSHASRNVEDVRGFLEDPEVPIIMHNAKFDMHMMRSIGVEINGPIYDTAIMAHIFNETIKPASLEYLSQKLLGERKMVDEIKEWQKANKVRVDGRGRYDLIPEDIIVPYAKIDAELTYKLYMYLMPILKSMGLWSICMDECKLTRCVLDMECVGARVDLQYFEELKEKYTQIMEDRQKDVWEEAGAEFNISSPKQLAEVLLARDIQLPTTKKGNWCTKKEVLEEINDIIIEKILDYRYAVKILSTFIKSVLENANGDTIHTNFKITGCRTGRFSSSQPNLQNLPKEDPIIRGGFISKPGFTNYYIDYKQMEYRVFIWCMQDERLIEKIKEGVDFHDLIAADFGFKPEERKMAKTLNFGIIYGMKEDTLARKLGMHKLEATWYLREYFERLPKAKETINRIKREAKEKGYLKNPFGRRVHVSKKENYKALNYYIQGTCADIVKTSMARVHELLLTHKSYLSLMVHDELVISIANGEEYLIPIITKIMEDWDHMFNLPMTVGVSYSTTNWGEKVKEEVPEDV